jgi:hypothetical protein
MDKLARREVILNGVIELLATRGLEGVTHRSVDEIGRAAAGFFHLLFPKKGRASHLRSTASGTDSGKGLRRAAVGFAETAAKQGLDAAVAYVATDSSLTPTIHGICFWRAWNSRWRPPAARILQVSVQS